MDCTNKFGGKAFIASQVAIGALAIATLSTLVAGPSPQAQEIDRSITGSFSENNDSNQSARRLDLALQSIKQKNWPAVAAELQSVIDAKSFSGYSTDLQYRTLAIAARVFIFHGSKPLGLVYLKRAIAMPQAGYDDWRLELAAESDEKNTAAVARVLTHLLQQWPDRANQLNPDWMRWVIIDAEALPRATELTLLKALFDVHWKQRWDIEPSAAWRNLTLIYAEDNDMADASAVVGQITDPYILIGMRADRRFDRVVAANGSKFDIPAAVERELRDMQRSINAYPKALGIRARFIGTLISFRHYEAALADSDSILQDIRSTNYPSKLFEDFEDERAAFFNFRALALERAGRWDEAVEQLSAAGNMHEKYGGNVSELINLGALYNDLGRPQEALNAIGNVLAQTSPYGAMQLESVRVASAYQLGDSKQVEISLKYMEDHRADASATYVDALVGVNQFDRAALELIAQLADPRLRQEALMLVQEFASATETETPIQLAFDSAMRKVLSRADVQRSVRQVGRIEHYNFESP